VDWDGGRNEGNGGEFSEELLVMNCRGPATLSQRTELMERLTFSCDKQGLDGKWMIVGLSVVVLNFHVKFGIF